jgi:tetratricopeptide (TPR) repeat protein
MEAAMSRGLASLFAGLTLLGAGAGAAPAGADQLDPRLDELFVRLQDAGDTVEAGRLERRIWRIWIATDDPEASRLMAEGTRAMALGRLVQARDRFDLLVALEPDFAEAWNKRATVHYLMGDYVASVQDIQQTLALERRHFGALSGLGMIYEAIDRPSAALRSFEAALAINPHLDSTRQRIEELRRELEGSRT